MRARRVVATGLASATLLAAGACGGTSSGSSEESSGKDTSSRSSSTAPSPSTTASPTTAVSGTGGRILLVPADAPGRLGRCTPAPEDGVVCSADRRTTYRFQPNAVRTLRVTAASATNQAQTWVVQIKVDAAGTRALTALTTTAARTRQQLLVLLPSSRRLLSAPQVNSPITSGDLQITGGFDQARATSLVRQITSTGG